MLWLHCCLDDFQSSMKLALHGSLWLQTATRCNQDFQTLVKLTQAEAEDLRGKLKRSEEARHQLENELSQFRAEAGKWEDVLDALQVLICWTSIAILESSLSPS